MQDAETVLAERYRLGATIGAGGMGRVVEGWDLVLGTPVAVKLLASGVRDPRSVERFRREAIASSRLGHPNIVVTHDVVVEQGEMALVMEKVEGPTLRTLLQERGPLPVELVLDLALQLADGLAAVHAIGVVHRDLKPANLLLEPTPSGPRLKIADFGIASLPDKAQMTQVGSVLGTPAYMAPERFRGVAGSPAQDVYSFGVILHELLTGRAPLEADSPLEMLGQLMQRSEHRITLPSSPLTTLITEALRFDPSARPANAGEALRRLRAMRPPRPAIEDEDEGAVVVLGGVPLGQLLPKLGAGAEVGQAIDQDIVVRFEAAEAAFRWTRDAVRDDPRLRAAFDAGTVVGAGLGLFAGEAVGRAARLARIATPGEVLVGPGGRRAIGLGLRAGLEPLGLVHLAGISRDTPLFRVPAEHAAPAGLRSIRIENGVGKVQCQCDHVVEAAVPHLANGARLACSRCGRVMHVPPITPPPEDGDANTRDLVKLSAPAEDDTILNELSGA